MNDTCRDFYTVYFGKKDTSISLDQLKKSRHAPELDSILVNHAIKNYIILDQIHSDVGVYLQDNLSKGSSVLELQGDFLVTNQKNIGLIVLTADCVPLVLVDPVNKAVGIVHAGWKGSFLGVLDAALKTMKDIYQTNYKDLEVFFGPSALACCYEVSLDFVKNFEEKFGKTKAFFLKNQQNYFDNTLFLQENLKKYGILDHKICTQNSFCTICNINCCSFRREKSEARRHITMVALV